MYIYHDKHQDRGVFADVATYDETECLVNQNRWKELWYLTPTTEFIESGFYGYHRVEQPAGWDKDIKKRDGIDSGAECRMYVGQYYHHDEEEGECDEGLQDGEDYEDENLQDYEEECDESIQDGEDYEDENVQDKDEKRNVALGEEEIGPQHAWAIEDPKERSAWIGIPQQYNHRPELVFYREVLVIGKRGKVASYTSDGSHHCTKFGARCLRL
ncbi:hypothetical protein NHQ30_004847 [Ciborinia camelliae]|nr:hypothetical protein NHQ30_004847 [Ciborinia camelliae]